MGTIDVYLLYTCEHVYTILLIVIVSHMIIIVSGNDLSPIRRQAIAWNNASLLSIRPQGTNSCKICNIIQLRTF